MAKELKNGQATPMKKDQPPSLFNKAPLNRGSLEVIDPAAVAAAEAAKARIQSAYIMAMHRPRNTDQARDSILRACKRTGFAEKVEFSKPVAGKQIKGPSVRFAELALKEWGNVLTETQVVYEDELTRRLKVFCTDLETNLTHSKEIVVNKTVERKKPTEDREIVHERINTKGEKVYIVRATEDELQNKESALISKAIRNEGLRLIPTDIIDEGIETARETLKIRDKQDPDAAKKQALDSFSEIGVRPKDIEAYLGHSMDTIVPAELQDLRAMYRAIKDGEATWREYIEKEGEKERPEISTADIAKFDQISTEKKVDPATLQLFLKETAEANEMTIEQVKVEALKELSKFYDRYDRFAQMASKKK
jgi:hypothetical protein